VVFQINNLFSPQTSQLIAHLLVIDKYAKFHYRNEKKIDLNNMYQKIQNQSKIH